MFTGPVLRTLAQMLSKPPPFRKMWHKKSLDELKAPAYRCKKDRSVAYKIRQNVFPAGDPPRVPLGAHNYPETPPHSFPTGTSILQPSALSI